MLKKPLKLILIIKFLLISGVTLHITYWTVGLFQGYLGVNPVETLTHDTGRWGLYTLMATLAITPLRRVFGWNKLVRFRRMLGLISFTYILLHLLVFLLFDHQFDWVTITEDILERPYITFGIVSFIILFFLAVTSLQALQRQMGKWWLRLHRLVYLAAVLGVLHFALLVKADIREPLIYGLIIAFLLSVRVYFYWRSKHLMN